MLTATKVNTNIRLDTTIREQVDQIATGMGLTFSAVVKLLLRKFITEKRIEIGLPDDHISFYKNNPDTITVNEKADKVAIFLKKSIKHGQTARKISA